MDRSAFGFALVAVSALALSGCNRGYQTAAELETAERGPTHCASSCHELGMRMSAFVLVDRGVAGCVCEPLHAPPVAYPAQPPTGAYPAPPPAGAYPAPPPAVPPPAAQPQSRASAGAAAGYAVLEAQRRQQEDEQARRASMDAMRRK
ncbi:hypothetical protein [Sorangium sp. So ce854]|uniref:hypothetical protein n=1 Tax=Sorangium sp. So ce854 TaxID=3133322 RepID=UPI003F635707